MSDYEYDVFISYRRAGGSFKWLMNNFHPRLVDCLADQLPHEPRVFLARQMERGVFWPQELEHALLHAKVLVSIYTPMYFQSAWCMAEWKTMREREKLLGLGTPERSRGLIYPILFSDSENFPEEARYRSWWDFKPWAMPDPVYQETKEWIGFHRQVEGVAIELARLLPRVPPWQPDWPVERPEPALPPHVPLPRF